MNFIFNCYILLLKVYKFFNDNSKIMINNQSLITNIKLIKNNE